VNLVHALAWSCDVYFYKVGGGYADPQSGWEEVSGLGLNIERLGQWMDLYGLGRKTGIELAGEIGGSIPSPAWKRRTYGENWSTGDTYNSAFGQGYVLVTPLQMLNITNTIANNGVDARPTLIREIRDADGNVVQGLTPDLHDMRDALRDFWPDHHDGQAYPDTLSTSLSYVQEGMFEAVNMNIDHVHQGTAIQIGKDLPFVQIAGKTGTAEYCDNIAKALERCDPGHWPAHAWFMAYAPFTNPEISVIAFVYNGQEGSTYALPVVSAVMQDYFTLKTQRAAKEQHQQTQPAPNVPQPTPRAP
jgi:penicillin-binding protein 2